MSKEYIGAEDLIILIAEDKDLKKDEVIRHFNHYNLQVIKNNTNKEFALALSACALLQSDYKTFQKVIENLLYQNNSTTDPMLWFLVGLKYIKTQKYTNAITALQISASHKPSFSKKYLVHAKLIDCYVLVRNYTETIDYISTNLSEFPSNYIPAMYCNLGYCYEQLNQQTNAIEYYRQIISLNSSFSIVTDVWLSFLESRFENLQEKILSLESKFVANSQSSFDWKYLLALFYIETEQFDEAIKILVKISCVGCHQYLYLCSLGTI